MARRFLTYEEEETEINLSPMIDCIFILLIFFIVTTVFVEETGVEVTKPDAASSLQLEKQSILLAITEDNKVVYGGKEIGVGGVVAQIKPLLVKDPDMPVIVQADREELTFRSTEPAAELRAFVDGTDLAFAAQAPDVVPYPTKQDLPETGDDPLADLAGVSPERLVGKSNADLTEQYGLAVEGAVGPAVDAERPAGVSVGTVADDSPAAPDGAGPIEYVGSAVGSLFEVGRLEQGARLTVYGDATVQTVPGRYAGLPYLRLEGEDGDVDRKSWLRLGLSAASEVFVASETEEAPGWLSAWSDTGDSLGTSAGTKRVFRRSLDAGHHWLSGVPTSDDVPTVFVREQ